MRNRSIALLASLLAATVVNAQTAPPLVNPTAGAAPAAAQQPRPAAAISENSTVDEVLDALDARGRNLREFVADVNLKETDEATQADSERVGKVWFQKQAEDNRMRVVFDQKLQGRFAKPEKLEYLLDKGWLTDRDYGRSVEVKRQVLRPGEKINLLKLGEGPFPLPIGQPKDQVHKEFEATRSPLVDGDPKGTVHVTLKPRKGTRLAEKFNVIEVWVDPRINMPVRIEALDVNETTRRQTDLSNIRVNPQPALGDREFTLPRIDENKWELHTEPFND
jgi:outer membrane lipoprotein-sorting protein